MIIEDRMGTILVDSSLSGVVVDQNGNRWRLTDEIDGLGLELIDSPAFTGVAVVALGPRVIKVKPEHATRQVPVGV
jgi:hypothetical protein